MGERGERDRQMGERGEREGGRERGERGRERGWRLIMMSSMDTAGLRASYKSERDVARDRTF